MIIKQMRPYRFFLLPMILTIMLHGANYGQGTAMRSMVPVYSRDARARDSVMAMRVPLLGFSQVTRKSQIPAIVDNSKNEYWPGVRDQYMFYTCQQYAGVVYVFTYEINRLRNQPGWFWNNSYPAHYTWNFMNQGDRYVGVNFLQSFEAIRQQGHMTSDDYGLDTSNSVLGWISGYDKYYRGMFNHVKQVSAIEVNSIEGIGTLKNYLYNHLDGSPAGGIACFTTSSSTLYNMPILPVGTPGAGKTVLLAWQSDPDHGMTVVGYNDSIRYDVNHDGKFTNNLDITGDGIVDARDWEIGGFKIANSYGTWWADTGFVYALYRSFALNYGEGGIWNNRVYVLDADTACRPLLTVRATVNYNARNKIRILAGVSSDTLAQFPEHVIDFPIFNFQGGEHVMTGNDTLPGAESIEFGLDVSDLLNYVPSGQPARFFMMVEERDPDQIGQGMIKRASFIRYDGSAQEIPVRDTDVVIRENNMTLVSAVAAFEKPDVRVATNSLPPFTGTQPLQVQLQASGGTPPYDWSVAEEYINKPSSTPEPLIGGTSIQVHYETRYFASVALPFSFPFFGKKYDSIYVNYDGFIAFEPQSLPAPYTTDETAMLRMFPLIVPSFSQQYVYQANKNDGIWYQANASQAVIRWKTSVSRYVTGSTDDFSVILYPDGRFEFCYGTMNNQGFVHTFYKGVSKGDGLNYDIQTQWNANDLSGKSFIFYPPVLPPGLNLSRSGFLTVSQADSSIIYGLNIRVADSRKISGSKMLFLSDGLSVADELICGNDKRLKKAMQASLKLVLTNNGSQPLQNLILKLRTAESYILLSDSSFTVPMISPGQTLTIPTAFSFRLGQTLPNNYPVMMTLRSQTATRTWSKELVFPVAEPELEVETPVVADGYNERLDPGEVAELRVSVRNTGSLMARNLQLKVISSDTVVTVLSAPQIQIGELNVFTVEDYFFQIKASRHAQPGMEVPVQVTLRDSSGVIQTLSATLLIGTRPVALVNLAASRASMMAMMNALESLNIGHDTISDLLFSLDRYSSIFLILGTASSGSHVLTDQETAALVTYLQHGGNLYLESYYTWYYFNKTALLPMFKYTSKKVPVYFYPTVKGVPQTFTEFMNYSYLAPINYSVFSLEPQAPAYPTLVNTDTPARNLEFAYHGSDYKTIGTMLDFSQMGGGSAPSTHTVLMQRYLEFFDLNITGPWPLFHAAGTSSCQGQTVMFSDDSFDNITTRNWEFPGGIPATSTEVNPLVRYDIPGKYDVNLTVSNGIHTRTILKQKYMHVDYCSGSGELANSSALFRIYPNPATDHVTIEINRNFSGHCKITIFDLTGRTLMEQTPSPDGIHELITLNLAGFRGGLYFVRVQAGSSVSTLKLMLN